MFTYSPGVMLTWQIGASETAHARYQYIEREQIFIGLLKAKDLLKPEILDMFEIDYSDVGYLEAEFEPIEELLAKFKVERAEVRRSLRDNVGKGNYQHKEKVVHRSKECKAIFEQAKELAKKGGSSILNANYLLKAILENPGSHIKKVLENFGIQIEEFKQVAWELKDIELEAVGVGAKKGKKDENKYQKTYFLDKFGTDLTRLAREGKIEPLIGRKGELLQIIRTLCRKTKNNPVLIGEPGVGKTAIVKGLALRIASGNINPSLQGRRIIEINMGSLVAGTKYRGQFEERVTGIIKEAKAHKEIILFIDEIHTLGGAEKAEGSLDAGDIMKPALSEGEISCIGATTLSEYRKYIEKDPALERRFQPIIVREPGKQEAFEMLKGLKERYEKHHKVTIEDSALKEAVELSSRYLPDRYLPDKAIDLLDEACSRIKVNSVSFYEDLNNLESRIGTVTAEIIARILSDWTGIPLRQLTHEEQEKIANLGNLIKKRVIGQDEAVDKVVQVIKMERAGLKDPRRPAGVLLFLGTTGVGKTELARSLAETLFGSEKNIIRLDMSEYMEAHSVSRLIGSPPGYVGYEEEGQLTGKLRTNPYSIVLLDEIEKAHPKIFDLFLQVFDEGRLTDSKGRTVNAKNAIFIMTSNIGSDIAERKFVGFGNKEEGGGNQAKEAVSQLKNYFRPEFLNRVDEIIYFRELQMEDLSKIAKNMLNILNNRLQNQNISLNIEQQVINFICKQSYDPKNGARPLARTIERLITKPISERIIKGDFASGDKIGLGLRDGKIYFYK